MSNTHTKVQIEMLGQVPCIATDEELIATGTSGKTELLTDIVKHHNNHDALVEALKLALSIVLTAGRNGADVYKEVQIINNALQSAK